MIYSVKTNKKPVTYNTQFNVFLLVALVLTLVQIVLGTDVREQVDIVSKTGAPEVMWLQNPTVIFYIHRSFSILVFALNGYLFYMNRKLNLNASKQNWVMFLLLVEILTGITMYYFDFPFGTQTLHLVLATLLFGVQFYLVLESYSQRNKH